ncbi:sigma-54 dependent transcriptional regulator [Compostibacter hankyongensis]|uniref:Sigma-54 dependent transcriptional regulator n=1 Tax=Compostibacter hankyongensis TaxID=1007089 RepID=A0ABP8FMG2_9BACT
MLLKQARVLVIDDDPDVLTAVRMLLKTEAGEVVTERNPENIQWLLSRHSFQLVLLDMNFNSATNTGNEGLYWLKRLKEIRPDTAVIMITAYGDIDLAVRSLKEGADDFVVKPWHNEKLIATFHDVLRKRSPHAALLQEDSGEIIGSELLGGSPAMEDIFHKIRKIAPTDANILILGENGTGKDLIARAVHGGSLRVGKPFVKVDVGALTSGLFESELFGYKKGAFTDATEDRVGRFEVANGGTLFLDEIGNISLHQQAKLLTVLQNRQVVRLGTHETVPVNIRLICATNLPISELSDEQRFRKDLIYRINTIEIVVPPLRERGEDILLLARHFAKSYARKYLKPSIGFSRPAEDKLMQYHFPGNVRELQYIIERAVIMAEEDELQAKDIIFSPIESSRPSDIVQEETNLGAVERNTILKVIEKNNGNITRAAKELGLTRTALYRRLSKYDI